MMKRSVSIRRLSRFGSFPFVAGAGAWLGLATLTTFAAADPLSCPESPERQQFDYWLGDWTITYPGAPGGSTSKVYLTLDKCVLVESWDGAKDIKVKMCLPIVPMMGVGTECSRTTRVASMYSRGR
jgi:hypothetical protein